MSSTRIRELRHFLARLRREVKRDHLSNGAGALAFYLVLALFPAAIFVLSMLPYLPIPHLREAILDLIHQALPGSAAGLFTSTVDATMARRSGGLLSFGFAFAIWSASNGLHAVMQQLNVIYDVEEERSFVRAHATALLLTVAFFVLVVGALGLVVFGGVVQSYIGDHLGFSPALLTTFATLRWVIIVFALHLAFALTYHYGPNLDRPFVLVTFGSVFATVAMVVTSVSFNLYISHFASYDAVYGSLGAVIVLLMWLFVTGWVILLGGEINWLAASSSRGDADDVKLEAPGPITR